MGNNESTEASAPIPSPTESRKSIFAQRPLAYGSNISQSDSGSSPPLLGSSSSSNLSGSSSAQSPISTDQQNGLRLVSTRRRAKDSEEDDGVPQISTSRGRSPEPNATEPVFDFATGCLLHPISKTDTLAGLAVRYGARVEDIKRVNKLWNPNDIWMLKVLKIPTDLQQYRASQEAAIVEKQAATLLKFLEVAGELLQKEPMPVDYAPEGGSELSEDIARDYLSKTRFNLDAAVQLWREDLHKSRFMYEESSKTGASKVIAVDRSLRQQHEDLEDEVFGL